LTVSLFHHGDEMSLLTLRAVLAYSKAFPSPRPDWNPPRAYILRHVGRVVIVGFSPIYQNSLPGTCFP